MSEKPRHPPEFRRYRQALLAAYFAVGGLVALLIAASVIYELFFQRPDRARLPEPSPADLVACNADVQHLLEALGVEASELHLAAVKGDARDLGRRWEDFSRDWQRNWDEVNARCRFDELADTNRAVAYERMAWVHRNLITTKLEYREMMARFGEEQAREIARMREALDRSRADLQKRTGTPAGGPSPP